MQHSLNMEKLRLFIEQIYKNIPETWDNSKLDVNIPIFTTTYVDVFLKQIPFVYGLLDKDSKAWVFERCKDFRQERGIDASRSSNEFLYFFASEVVNLIKVDMYNGVDMLKENLLRDFEKVKENLFPYNPETGQTLKIRKFFGIGEDQNVYLVKDESKNTNWIMKWEQYDEENIEAKTYKKLERLGANVPNRLDGFKFLDFGVLVIEFLFPMDITDKPSAVARQLLQQLKVLHTFACYFDLKTDNIRKRNSNPPRYFIIDMNLSTTMKPDGTFERLHWTPYYSSQIFPNNINAYQRSSYLNDLIELKYVIHQLIFQRAYETKHEMFDMNYSEKRKKDIYGLEKDDFFADPDRMMKNSIIKTARGWRCVKQMLEFPPDTSYAPSKRFHSIIENLNHGFPPANIHDLLSTQMDIELENMFWNETQSKLSIQCNICNVRKAFAKCGECYNQVTFVCSESCALKHTCK